MTNKQYIYVNSYPRSGSTFLETCLNAMYSNSKEILLDTPAKVLHNPELLSESLQGILQVSIIRDLPSAVSSFMIKDIGFMLNVPGDVASDDFHSYIKNKIEYYEKYIDCINNNINNVLVLRFEDVVDKTEEVLTSISKNVNLSIVNEIKQSIDISKDRLKSSSEYNQFHNSIPIRKPKLYSEVVDYINNRFAKEIEGIDSKIKNIFI